MTKRIRVTFEMDLPNGTANRSDLNHGILTVIQTNFPTLVYLDVGEVDETRAIYDQRT